MRDGLVLLGSSTWRRGISARSGPEGWPEPRFAVLASVVPRMRAARCSRRALSKTGLAFYLRSMGWRRMKWMSPSPTQRANSGRLPSLAISFFCGKSLPPTTADSRREAAALGRPLLFRSAPEQFPRDCPRVARERRRARGASTKANWRGVASNCSRHEAQRARMSAAGSRGLPYRRGFESTSARDSQSSGGFGTHRRSSKRRAQTMLRP